MVICDQRILAQSLRAFSHHLTRPIKHVQHKHSKQMNQQSDIVSQGVMDNTMLIVVLSTRGMHVTSANVLVHPPLVLIKLIPLPV